jgi:hypothetical protein
VQSFATGVRADDVGESRVLIDGDVMPVCEIRIKTIGRKALRRHQTAQAGQVEDLHPVRARTIRDDIGMVLIDLDIAPD